MMLKKIVLIVSIVIIAAIVYWLVQKPTLTHPLPTTAVKVDLTKYSGTWHEIALIPNRYEKGCSNSTSTYTPMQHYIKVINKCFLAKKQHYRIIIGKIWSTNISNSKLKIQFFWPFRGDYWILYVNNNYRYAVVGEPTRRLLWVLARTKTIPAAIYTKLVKIAKKQGFDTNKLVKAP